jgi:hypothetical protein
MTVTNEMLRDVHMVSTADGWAVGENGVVLRYNGVQWSVVPTFTAETLVDVHMISSNEGYILGWGEGNEGGNVYRWNGTAWTHMYDTPADPNRMDDIGSNSLWIAGLFHIYHYNGTSWSTVFTDTRNIFSLQMYSTGSGPGGWAVGANQFMAEYENGTWTVLAPSPAPQTLYHNSFSSPTDGWAVGFTATTYILHWNGSQWNWEYTLPDTYLDRLYMLSPTLGWGTSFTGQIFKFNGSAWTEDHQGSQGFRNIYMLGPTEGWAVGEFGIMAHYYDDATPTAIPSNTTVSTVQPTSTSTGPPTSTRTPGGATPTSTACTLTFTDVQPTDTFYPFIRCLACRGIIGGYSDGTFRPNNDITRGQIAKMVSNAAGFTEPVSGQTFEDVPTGSPFYEFIERLVGRGHMGGYQCGLRETEPCVPPENRPYFRPNENATRGQISKIVSNAAGFSEPATGQFYADVTVDNPFYNEIMRLTTRNVMSGYPCGGPGEPCDSENRPYFRWGNRVTRGQASKIVANTFFPNCSTP